MKSFLLLVGLLLIVFILWDAFETVILSRRVRRKLRLARLFYSATWHPWATVVRLFYKGKNREHLLGFFGPMSLIFLLVLWASSLIVGFAFLQLGVGAELRPFEGMSRFATHVYYSGTTFFTLGVGDTVPADPIGRALTVAEAGLGFLFLALVIGFLPGLSQAFSRREVDISLLDARAGSPPTALELLRRNRASGEPAALRELLAKWEIWSADLMESHISFPILTYFRSQHDNQSWVASLTAVLDTCALLKVGLKDGPGSTATLTFAMARHAVVDLCEVLERRPFAPRADRLPSDQFRLLAHDLDSIGMPFVNSAEAEARLAALRLLYEPYVNALADELWMPLPAWMPIANARDNWQGGS